jgi:Ca2+-binding EF-hand superfamily protein
MTDSGSHRNDERIKQRDSRLRHLAALRKELSSAPEQALATAVVHKLHRRILRLATQNRWHRITLTSLDVSRVSRRGRTASRVGKQISDSPVSFQQLLQLVDNMGISIGRRDMLLVWKQLHAVTPIVAKVSDDTSEPDVESNKFDEAAAPTRVPLRTQRVPLSAVIELLTSASLRELQFSDSFGHELQFRHRATGSHSFTASSSHGARHNRLGNNNAPTDQTSAHSFTDFEDYSSFARQFRELVLESSIETDVSRKGRRSTRYDLVPAFKFFDVNSRELIDSEDLIRGLQGLGFRGRRQAPTWMVARLIREMDSSRQIGVVSYDAFARWLLGHNNINSAQVDHFVSRTNSSHVTQMGRMQQGSGVMSVSNELAQRACVAVGLWLFRTSPTLRNMRRRVLEPDTPGGSSEEPFEESPATHESKSHKPHHAKRRASLVVPPSPTDYDSAYSSSDSSALDLEGDLPALCMGTDDRKSRLETRLYANKYAAVKQRGKWAKVGEPGSADTNQRRLQEQQQQSSMDVVDNRLAKCSVMYGRHVNVTAQGDRFVELSVEERAALGWNRSDVSESLIELFDRACVQSRGSKSTKRHSSAPKATVHQVIDTLSSVAHLKCTLEEAQVLATELSPLGSCKPGTTPTVKLRTVVQFLRRGYAALELQSFVLGRASLLEIVQVTSRRRSTPGPSTTLVTIAAPQVHQPEQHTRYAQKQQQQHASKGVGSSAKVSTVATEPQVVVTPTTASELQEEYIGAERLLVDRSRIPPKVYDLQSGAYLGKLRGERLYSGDKRLTKGQEVVDYYAVDSEASIDSDGSNDAYSDEHDEYDDDEEEEVDECLSVEQRQREVGVRKVVMTQGRRGSGGGRMGNNASSKRNATGNKAPTKSRRGSSSGIALPVQDASNRWQSRLWRKFF